MVLVSISVDGLSCPGGHEHLRLCMCSKRPVGHVTQQKHPQRAKSQAAASMLTVGLKLFCELRCGCWGNGICGAGCWTPAGTTAALRGVGGSGRFACGGSGTTISRWCGRAGRDGGPTSSTTDDLSPRDDGGCTIGGICCCCCFGSCCCC